MNTKDISKDKILKISKLILKRDGLNNLSIRNIAKEANVSIGSVYKYYDNKSEILLEIACDSWDKIIKKINNNIQNNLEDTIYSIYYILYKNNKPTDGLLNHSKLFSNKKINKALEKMENYQKDIKQIIKNSIIEDARYNVSFGDLQLDDIVNLIFDTIINDISNNKTNYQTLTLIINSYFIKG